MLGKLFFILVAIGLCEGGCPKCYKFADLPVCGTDGRTHRNMCALVKRRCQTQTKIELLYPGVCADFEGSFPRATAPQPEITYQPIDCSHYNIGPRASLPCGRELDRQCGNDLENYINVCKMCRANKPSLNIRHNGKCTDYELALSGKAYPREQRSTKREIAPLRLPRMPNCKNAFTPCSHTYGHMVCASNGIIKKMYSGGECELCNKMREAELRGEPRDMLVIKVGGIC